jgi:hypothetical protein
VPSFSTGVAKKHADLNKKLVDLINSTLGAQVPKEALKQLLIDCGLPIEQQNESTK